MYVKRIAVVCDMCVYYNCSWMAVIKGNVTVTRESLECTDGEDFVSDKLSI